MKNLKRFLSIILAMAMFMSLNAVAFAAEADDSYAPAADAEMVFISDVDYSTIANSDQGVMPLADPAQLTTMVEVRNQQNYGDKLASIPEKRYITIVITTPVACDVTVYYKNDSATRRIPAGTGKYTICEARGSGFTYQVRFNSVVNYAVFQFFATEGGYNG